MLTIVFFQILFSLTFPWLPECGYVQTRYISCELRKVQGIDRARYGVNNSSTAF